MFCGFTSRLGSLVLPNVVAIPVVIIIPVIVAGPA